MQMSKPCVPKHYGNEPRFAWLAATQFVTWFFFFFHGILFHVEEFDGIFLAGFKNSMEKREIKCHAKKSDKLTTNDVHLSFYLIRFKSQMAKRV